jgi:hypothetical protein
MAIYQDYETFGTRENDIQVWHSCGHRLDYSYGGTAPYFEGPRKAFSARQADLPCPDCRMLAALRNDNDLPIPGGSIPVVSSGCGPGNLKMVDGRVVLILDRTVLQEETDLWKQQWEGKSGSGTGYTWRCGSPAPGACAASYLHRVEGHAYTPEQEAWMREYDTRSLADQEPGRYEGRYHCGRSWRTWEAIEEAEHRLGRPIALTAPCDEQGNILRSHP